MLTSILQPGLRLVYAGLSPGYPVWPGLPAMSAVPNSPEVPTTTTVDLSPGTVCGYLRVPSYNPPQWLENQTRRTRRSTLSLSFSLRVESTRSTRSGRSGYTPSTRISRAHACTRVWTRALGCMRPEGLAESIDRLVRRLLVLVVQPYRCATQTPYGRIGLRHTTRRKHHG